MTQSCGKEVETEAKVGVVYIQELQEESTRQTSFSPAESTKNKMFGNALCWGVILQLSECTHDPYMYKHEWLLA